MIKKPSKENKGRKRNNILPTEILRNKNRID